MLFHKGVRGTIFACIVLCCQYTVSNSNSVKRELDLCEQQDCRAGRECVVKKGVAECQCVKSCPKHAHRVCGSDEITYHNYCELHKTACVEKRHIRANYKGPCKAKHLPPKNVINALTSRDSEHVPLVCSASRRDKLRKMVMDWLLQLISGDKYEKVVRRKFKECDYDQDGHMTSDELLACLEDHGIAKFSDIKDGIKEHLMRGLCVDAIIGIGDRNADWQLDVKEYVAIMEPEFVAKEKVCHLEGKTYKEGNMNAGHCKICICSSGRWVCGGNACDKGCRDDNGRNTIFDSRCTLLRPTENSTDFIYCLYAISCGNGSGSAVVPIAGDEVHILVSPEERLRPCRHSVYCGSSDSPAEFQKQ